MDEEPDGGVSADDADEAEDAEEAASDADAPDNGAASTAATGADEDATPEDAASETDGTAAASGDDAAASSTGEEAPEADAEADADDETVEEAVEGDADVDTTGDTDADASMEADADTDAEADADADEVEADADADVDGDSDANAEVGDGEADEEVEALTADEALAAERAQDESNESNISAAEPALPENAPEDAQPSVEYGDDMVLPEDEEDDAFGIDGPEDDVELPLAAHIEEMVWRLAAVIVVAGIVSVFLFPLGEEVIMFIWNSLLPNEPPRLYHPLALVLTQFKVASLGGLIVALPVFVYQTYRFMRPGLYPHERRYYLAAVPTSLVLAVIGVLFAYFVVLPAIFFYFLNYTQTVAIVAFDLSQTFDLILLLMGYLAIVFQIPLFIMLAIMIGVTSREWLEGRRLYFWGGFLGLSLLFSPDPTGMAPFIVAVTMVTLFEGTLALLRWTGN